LGLLLDLDALVDLVGLHVILQAWSYAWRPCPHHDPSEMHIFNDLIWTRILLTFSSVAKASPGVICKKNPYSLPDFA
jgi:hypothetical protein